MARLSDSMKWAMGKTVSTCPVIECDDASPSVQCGRWGVGGSAIRDGWWYAGVMSVISAVIILLLVMDPIGNVPLFLSVLRNIGDGPRRRRIIIRESLIALMILLLFLFFGRNLLALLQVEPSSLRLAGGVVLFLIALRILFPSGKGVMGDQEFADEPLVVPLAVPLLAGPSTMATVMLLATKEPERMGAWCVALIGAWGIALTVLLSGELLAKVLGKRGLLAMERLMGMLLIVIAVQMLMGGIAEFVEGLRAGA